jgi:hypothetical protein
MEPVKLFAGYLLRAKADGTVKIVSRGKRMEPRDTREPSARCGVSYKPSLTSTLGYRACPHGVNPQQSCTEGTLQPSCTEFFP